LKQQHPPNKNKERIFADVAKGGARIRGNERVRSYRREGGDDQGESMGKTERELLSSS